MKTADFTLFKFRGTVMERQRFCIFRYCWMIGMQIGVVAQIVAAQRTDDIIPSVPM